MLFFDPALSASGRMACATCHDPTHGIGASCHPGTASPDGKPPLFTDFGYAALGVPCNRAMTSNNDLSFFDLGLCGPYRTALAGATQ
jgi:cytochrome c peroxidase